MLTLCLHSVPFRINLLIFDQGQPCYPEILLFGHCGGLVNRSPDTNLSMITVQHDKPHSRSNKQCIHSGAKHSKSRTAGNIPSRAANTPNEDKPATIRFSSSKQWLSQADPTSQIDWHCRSVDQKNADKCESAERVDLRRRWSCRRETAPAGEG